MGRFMAKNTIKLGGILLNRHSCMLLAGIHALKTRPPIQNFGGDVMGEFFMNANDQLKPSFLHAPLPSLLRAPLPSFLQSLSKNLSADNGSPIRDFGDDGFLDMWYGKSL
jgi:hypothetical protein